MSPSKDHHESGSSTSKIAIKGFSLSSKSKPNVIAKPKAPTSSLGKRSRSSFAHDSASDSEGESTGRGRHETVTGFGADGAIKLDEKKPKEALVIPKLNNRDWKNEARARRGGTSKNLLPPEVLAAQERAKQARAQGEGKREGVDVVNSTDGEIQWGLSVRKRVKVEDDASAPAAQEEVEAERNGDQNVAHTTATEKPQNADDEALQALLATKKEVKGPDLVIAAVRESTPTLQISEGDAYKRAIELAPEVSTLEDYERVPVEEFGAALLRGMGWKGEKRGGAKEVKRRQNLLGLGAKELKGAEELGAWVQKSDIKRLNGNGKGSGGFSDKERRPKASEYRREKEKRDERREERGGGSYRRERERERDGYRDRDGYRERERDRRW